MLNFSRHTKNIIILIILVISSVLTNTYAEQPKVVEPLSVNKSEQWNCWGKQKISYKYYGNSPVFSVATDVCVRDNLRPLTVNVNLNNINVTSQYDEYKLHMRVTATHKITGKSKTLTFDNLYQKSVNNMVRPFEFPATRSGYYKISIELIRFTFLYKKNVTDIFEIDGNDARHGVGYIVGGDFGKSRSLIVTSIESVEKNGKPIHVVFGENYEVPVLQGSEPYTMAVPANLLIIPKQVNNQQFVTPHLLGDRHRDISGICELAQNNYPINDWSRIAEMYSPEAAWFRMQKPMIVFNASYLDLEQRWQESSKWWENFCATPVGLYFDNILPGPTNGTQSHPNMFIPGTVGFVSDVHSSEIPLDSMFWTISPYSKMEIAYSVDDSSSNLISLAKNKYDAGDKFIAFSGMGLKADRNRLIPETGSPTDETIRLAISKTSVDESIYIFQGGLFENGLDREDLLGIFQSFTINDAIEMEGTGYSAIGIDVNEFIQEGDERPSSTCISDELWCSKSHKDGYQHRPSPTWVSLNR
ncbi:hypothetical protein [Proteus sp. ZN5]|uniref:hypothetical protein n=1 Tax=Proteus sp. ZN5 TaxID=2697019 RepID=UPI0013E157AA|nr:hypothetical protein [Proteus sp. ZN5]QIG04917.1 hypothetical protein GTK47_06005 [Proteus sp. ZN5]